MHLNRSSKEKNTFKIDIVWLIVIAQFVSGQDFKIDSQLRILTNDCYTRIAIGSRLPINSAISTISGSTLTGCESLCSANRSRCNVFDFGVDARGNGTCTIGRLDVNERLGDLPSDRDHDVYERRLKNPNGCDHDRLVKIGYGSERIGGNVTGSSARQKNVTFGRRKEQTTFFGNPFFSWNKNLSSNDRQPSFFRGGWSRPIADDEDTRLYDILIDRRPFHEHNSWSSKFLNPSTSAYDSEIHNDLCSKSSGTMPIFCKTSNPSLKPSPPILYQIPGAENSEEHEPRYRNKLLGSTDFFTDFGAKIDPVLEKSKACYRKLLAGKRMLDNHVRRNVACERIEDCRRVCEYESAFACEGFNYGRMDAVPNYGRSAGGGEPRRGYMCQLTSVSNGRMDPRHDFVDDPRYDYYARDWTCPAGKVHRDSYERDWSSNLPARRPNNRNNWPLATSFSLSDPSAGPLEPPFFTEDTRSYYPPERFAPTRNRPGEYDYYPTTDRQRPWGSYLPQRPDYSGGIGQHRYYYGSQNGDRDYYANRRSDDQRIWRHRPPGPNDIVKPNSGVTYGGSYGYGSNYYPYQRSKDYPARDHYDYWPKTRGAPRKPSVPDQQDRHYGSNYGPAYGYHSPQGSLADSYRPTWKPPHRRTWLDSGPKDCSIRSLMGFKITRKIVAASHVTANLEECEMLCSARRDCFSFAYRYSLVVTAPTDNCLLSNVPFDKLDFYTDVEPDRDYDIYAIIGDPKQCQEVSPKPGSGQVTPHRRSPEECFWRVRSGCGIPPSLTRKKIRAENGLGECQIACITARHFTCRSFSFRYDSEGDREANCFLSDCATREIIAAIETDTSLISLDGHMELYERGSYGRGCEASPFTPIYNSASIGEKAPPAGQGTGGCWSGYQAGCKLSPYAVSSMSRVDSESECRRQCSRMRFNQRTPTCMSFSFRVGDEKHGDNCYLSDVPRRDLRPGLDYSYDDDYVMYAWKELEPQCSAPHGPGYDYPPPTDVKYNHDSGGDDYGPIVRPSGPLPPMGHGGSGLYSYNTLFLGVRPMDYDRPDSTTRPNRPTSTYLPHHQTNVDGYFPGPDDPDEIGSFNRHYTVNGYPCKRGTMCQINKIAGFWSCEPEGSEFGSWDYCCEPNHHCGFSQGYNYPWCYVGASEDQWRPCSEKYYPYLPSPRPAINASPNFDGAHPGIGGQKIRPSYRFEENGRSDEISRNCYEGRHWPIAFLHPIPPPNATDSVALANDRRDSNEQNVNKVSDNNPSSTTPGKIDRDKNTSSTTEKMTNSSIIRIQPYKSHLKRRGLISADSARAAANRTKASYKKFHRISITPAINDSLKTIPPDKTIPTPENESHFDKNATSTSRQNIEEYSDLLFDKKHENFTNTRNKSRFARIERVTRANIDLGNQPEKNNTHQN